MSGPSTTGAVTAPASHSSESRRANPNHRPALDGIRALAVVAVLLYHGVVSWAGGGFLGVDVFFVLSGYLITTLLLNEWRRWGSIDLVGFYVRRARRLLPALVLVVMAVAAWAALVAASDRLGAIRADGLSTLLYVANWRFIFAQQSYFDQFGDPSPFRHMWSLAIEEQYYLLFPLLLISLLRLAARRRWVLPVALTALAGASILAMAALYDPTGDPSRVYYGTDTRVHELMIGSLLAVVLTRLSQSRRAAAARLAPYVGIPALVGVLTAFLVLTDQSAWLYRGGFAVVCLVTALLVASVELAPRGPVAWLLSLPPVVWVGAVSYGLYLWHWPIYIACTPDRTGLDGIALLLLRLGTTAVVATASYYLVEQPIRRGSLARVPAGLGRAIGVLGIPAALAALVVGTLGATAPPLEASPFGPGPVAAGKQSLLIVGDSVGDSLVMSFPQQTYPNWSVQGSTILGCGLGSHQLAFKGTKGLDNPRCDATFGNWERAVAKAKPQAVLLSIGAWEVFDHVIDGKIQGVTTAAYTRYLKARLTQAYQILTSGGAHLFIPNVPCFAEPRKGEVRDNFADIRNEPERGEAVNEVINTFAANHKDTTVIDDASWLCPGGENEKTKNGVEIRYDGVHYSVPGGAMAWGAVYMPAVLGQPTDNRLRVLLVGDSVPLGLFERFPADSYPDLLVRDSTQLGCSSFAAPSVVDGEDQKFPDNCEPWQEQIPATIKAVKPEVGVVFVGIGEQFDKRVDGDVLEFGTPEHEAWLEAQLTQRIDLFRSAGVPVVLPTVTCHKVPDAGLNAGASIINDDGRVTANNALIQKVADSYAGSDGPRVTVLDLYSRLCSDGYQEEVEGVTLREDGLHFSDDGAAFIWTLLAPQVRAASTQ